MEQEPVQLAKVYFRCKLLRMLSSAVDSLVQSVFATVWCLLTLDFDGRLLTASSKLLSLADIRMLKLLLSNLIV